MSPLPLTGATAEAMHAWIAEGVARDEAGELERIFRTNDRGHEVLAAEGYALNRPCCVQEGEEAWTERVLVVRSPTHAARQAAGLATRLVHAEKNLAALTPPRGRGKRQITDEATLLEAISTVLKAQRVGGLLSVTWEKQSERKTQYVGRGRGSASREKRVIKHTRYHITHIARQEDKIAALTQQCGWKAFVTNAEEKRLSLQDAVLCYRNEYRVERIFNRLKSRMQIAPLFVKLQRPNRGPHVPAHARRPGVNGHGVCPAAVSWERSSYTPRFAPGEQAKDDRHANSGAGPESVFRCVADHHKECPRRGNPASADTLGRGAGGHPATAGVGYFSLPAA